VLFVVEAFDTSNCLWYSCMTLRAHTDEAGRLLLFILVPVLFAVLLTFIDAVTFVVRRILLMHCSWHFVAVGTGAFACLPGRWTAATGWLPVRLWVILLRCCYTHTETHTPVVVPHLCTPLRYAHAASYLTLFVHCSWLLFLLFCCRVNFLVFHYRRERCFIPTVVLIPSLPGRPSCLHLPVAFYMLFVVVLFGLMLLFPAVTIPRLFVDGHAMLFVDRDGAFTDVSPLGIVAHTAHTLPLRYLDRSGTGGRAGGCCTRTLRVRARARTRTHALRNGGTGGTLYAHAGVLHLPGFLLPLCSGLLVCRDSWFVPCLCPSVRTRLLPLRTAAYVPRTRITRTARTLRRARCYFVSTLDVHRLGLLLCIVCMSSVFLVLVSRFGGRWCQLPCLLGKLVYLLAPATTVIAWFYGWTRWRLVGWL
jgi:hypothetical protein